MPTRYDRDGAGVLPSLSYTRARKCSMRWHTTQACRTWPCRRGASLYMCVCRHKNTLKPEVPQYWIPSHESTAPIFIIPDPTIPTSTISTHEPLLHVGGLVERQDEGTKNSTRQSVPTGNQHIEPLPRTLFLIFFLFLIGFHHFFSLFLN